MSAQTGKSRYRVVRHYFAVLGLCLMTQIFFGSVIPYATEGEQMLLNPGFSDDLRAWDTRGKNGSIQVSEGVVEIKHPSLSQSSSISQCWERTELPAVALVGIEASSRGLVLGDKSWHEARVGLVSYAPQGKILYQLSNRLARLRDDRPWSSYSAALTIPHEAERVCFIIALYGSQGVFQVKNPTLYQAHSKQDYRLGRGMLLAIWLGLGVWWLKRLGTHYWRRPQGGYLLAILLAMAVGILMPHELKIILERGLLSLLPGLPQAEPLIILEYPSRFPPALFPRDWDLSKFSHLLGFFLLSGILFSERAKPVWLLLTGLLLAAVASETLQYFALGRTPRVSDLVVDGLGIVAGWWVVRLFYYFRDAFSSDRSIRPPG